MLCSGCAIGTIFGQIQLQALAKAVMEFLARQIRQQLQLEDGYWRVCPVCEAELRRLWPEDRENREAQIKQFAKERGWLLAYYKPGLGAIFEEPPTSRRWTELSAKMKRITRAKKVLFCCLRESQ